MIGSWLPRDDRHYNCVERQVWTSMALFVFGVGLVGVLERLGVPRWLIAATAFVALLCIPAVTLLADRAERERAAAECRGCRTCTDVDADEPAGRW